MPAFWRVVPPMPKQKRKRPQPGFTDDELRYLEDTLQIIESISLDPIGLETNEPSPDEEGELKARPSQRHTDDGTNSTWSKSIGHTRLWAFTHPNTVAMFLVFLASLLARNGLSNLQALVGFACLLAGLRIMAATGDGPEMNSRPRSVTLMHSSAEH